MWGILKFQSERSKNGYDVKFILISSRIILLKYKWMACLIQYLQISVPVVFAMYLTDASKISRTHFSVTPISNHEHTTSILNCNFTAPAENFFRK